jgi:branched-subunit amino acid transport protein
MTAPPSLVLAALVLGAGTFAFRVAGPVLRTRGELPPRVERLLAVGAVVLLVALVGTASLLDGHQFAGFARAIGVAVGGVLAWRKAPFVVVVVAAAATAAGLRLLGVP